MTTALCVSPAKHPAVRYRAPKTPGTTIQLVRHSTHITCRISRAINNCHRNRGSNAYRRRRNRFQRKERSGGGRAVQSLSSDIPASDIRLPCMNSRVHVRAVRAGVSLYKTAVLSIASRVLYCRLKGKETAQAGTWLQSWRGGTGAPAQTGGYVPVQMSPCGARITVTYEDGNTYSLCAHRLTSLVMRLLFPSRGNLFLGREKKERCHASEGFTKAHVFFS